jgi:hypothetical protein
VDEVDQLMGRLDRGSDLEPLREDIGALIVKTLKAEPTELSYWEKVHYEMAVALLPTVWLRLCLTHLKMASEPPLETPRFLADYERTLHFERLTADKLIERVRRTFSGDR